MQEKITQTFSRISRFIDTYFILFAFFLSLIATIISYETHVSLAYNDAMSHLNISRFVIDNLQPGFAQLGGVWPPLSHVLPLVFIWNDFMWHSGLAASIFSMISYIISAYALYGAIKILTKNTFAAIAGGAIFALNANILYLQTTPLTEPLYVVFFSLSIFCFAYWITKHDERFILLLGILGFFQVLTRYDGWFVTFWESILIVGYDIYVRKNRLTTTLAKLLLYAFPVVFGVTLWLLWNTLIFKNPLFFAIGPYSAHAQQSYLQTNASLITKHSLPISVIAYWYAMTDNIGLPIMILVGIGTYLLLMSKSYSLLTKCVLILFLESPIIFNILSLYLGFSIINVPELHWNPSRTISGEWFNVRYGIFILPLAAVMVGYVAQLSRKIALGVIVIAILQLISFFPNNVITVTDGLMGSSSFYNKDIATFLQQHVRRSDYVLLSVSYFNPVAFKSGIDLHQIVHEGVEKEWGPSLGNPEEYANWIVMSNGKTGDPVYDALIIRNRSYFTKDYVLAYKGIHANVYKLKLPQLARR
ncbi:MAG TPA: hypothetical protein VEW42_06675 [Candidatus Eisenbacteria bacterium]|nr:hypothetical protein [Candidatus Eisenbacteria bacterium]